MSPKPATPATVAANRAVLDALPFDDETDFDNARRGLIAEATGQVVDADGNVVWDIDRWSFLEGDAPDTVNPSLWRQARLNLHHGLFQVVDRIYQVRGFDLSNMTIIEGDAHQTVLQHKGPIDVLFLDADKQGYIDYLDKLLPLVRKPLTNVVV